MRWSGRLGSVQLAIDSDIAIVKVGWGLCDRDPQDAEKLFKRVIAHD